MASPIRKVRRFTETRFQKSVFTGSMWTIGHNDAQHVYTQKCFHVGGDLVQTEVSNTKSVFALCVAEDVVAVALHPTRCLSPRPHVRRLFLKHSVQTTLAWVKIFRNTVFSQCFCWLVSCGLIFFTVEVISSPVASTCAEEKMCF